MNENPGAIIPELALLGGAVLGLMLGLWLPRRRQWLVALVAVACLVSALAATGVAMGQAPEAVFSASFSVDRATDLVRLVVCASALLVVCLSVEPFHGHKRETEHYVLVLLASLGAVALAGADDLLLLVAAYLLASVPLYALVGSAKDAEGTEAALKYYLMGALLGIVMLFGVTVLFGVGRGTGYQLLRASLASAPHAAAAVGVVGVLAGLAFKMGAVPAQFWVPDVTEGAPGPVAAFVTTVPKVGALLATYRLLEVAIPAAAVDWRLLVALLAAASMTLGNLAAFWQDSPRRLLAYSTISQVGYVLLAVVVAGRSPLALPALLLYLGAYAVTNLGAFAVVVALPRARSLGDYAGLWPARPGLALALAVCLLGLVGTPPTAVFVGKLQVFTAAIDGGWSWLAALAVVNTVASVFYYLRWLAPTFLASPAPEQPELLEVAGRCTALGAYVAAGASVALGLASGGVLALARSGLLGS